MSDLTGTYYQKSETSSAVEISSALGGSAKISVDGELTQDFKFVHISYDDYAQLVIDEHTDPHTVYVLSGEGYDDQFGNRIANVGEPISTTDAATKGYVDAQISSIPKPDMSEYYKKTETSSST